MGKVEEKLAYRISKMKKIQCAKLENGDKFEELLY